MKVHPTRGNEWKKKYQKRANAVSPRRGALLPNQARNLTKGPRREMGTQEKMRTTTVAGGRVASVRLPREKTVSSLPRIGPANEKKKKKKRKKKRGGLSEESSTPPFTEVQKKHMPFKGTWGKRNMS